MVRVVRHGKNVKRVKVCRFGQIADSACVCTGVCSCLQENLKVETLQKQYQIVKRETNTSHVTEFGDMVRSRR